MPDERWLVAVHPTGEIKKKAIKKTPTLEDLQAIVGGSIELVPYFNTYEMSPCVAFCNEEGKLKHMPVNQPAQVLWAMCGGKAAFAAYADVLVGNIAIVVGSKQFLQTL